MNVNQLELGDPTCNDRMYVAWPVQPTDELAHENRNVTNRRRCVDRFAGRRVDDIVLDTPILPRRGGPATDTGHQVLVDFKDQSLGDWTAIVQVRADELESVTVIEQFAGVVRVRPRNVIARQKVCCLLNRKASALDMGRVVRFEKERPRAHRVDPLVRQTRSVEEPAGALNLGDGRCDCVRNGEARNEPHTAFVPLSYTETTVSISPAAKAFM